jgi:hypothetical protein
MAAAWSQSPAESDELTALLRISVWLHAMLLLANWYEGQLVLLCLCISGSDYCRRCSLQSLRFPHEGMPAHALKAHIRIC